MIAFQTQPEGFRQQLSSFFDSAAFSFAHFTVWDAVDILALAAILFFAFRFLNNRKFAALIVGIGICVVTLLLSSWLHLDALNYIMSGIFRFGALALLIIFQPEIRDALEKIGSGSIGSIKNLREKSKRRRMFSAAIEHICVAVKDLSASKTGALIVIERTTRLDEVVQTGVLIHADVNSFLIRNLFFNKAPLHDGAIVIQEAKIVAAGCLLPLTRRSDVDTDLGTRHRAAIGMSESSDAIVIVVSEETGRISVAHDCSLMRDFTADSLKTFLIKKICHGAGELTK